MRSKGLRIDDSSYEKTLARIRAAGLEYKRKSERVGAKRKASKATKKGK